MQAAPGSDGAQLVPYPGMFSARRGPLLIPTRPLQFPSLGHMDERVERALEHQRAVEGLQPQTIVWARRSYRSLRRFLCDAHEEAAFMSGDVERQVRILQAWIAWLRLQNVSRVSINNYWRGARSIFRWVMIADGTANPFVYIATPRVGRTNPRCLTKANAEALLEFVRHYGWRSRLAAARNLAIVGLMLLAGLRRGEVIRLKYGDVDLDGGTIRIVGGKGRFGGKDRTCYIPHQLRDILGAYMVERGRAVRTHPEFLTSVHGDYRVGAEAIRRVCDVASRALGFPLTPHALRHTYATLLRQAGVPDRVSMELMGHNSLAMLQRYSHVFSGEHLRAANKLRLDFEN